MGHSGDFHIVTVGWGRGLVADLWDPIAALSVCRFSHILHPRHTRDELAEGQGASGMEYLRTDRQQQMPEPDHELLASLEQVGVPTVHNMILGDRVLARLPYRDAMQYATFLARRLAQLFESLRPSAVIGGFDALHGSIALAVARKMNIPWFALNFSVIPPGLACFCDRMSPAARVQFTGRLVAEARALAEASLDEFESGRASAPAYIAPPALSIVENIRILPARMRAAFRIVRMSRDSNFWRFTEERTGLSVGAALLQRHRARRARNALSRVRTCSVPPETPYILFGLHTQPESSVDVWAPFFSNQMWVIELLARAIPPSHRLLVKIHKSDAAKYSLAQLRHVQSLPGVAVVQPFADTRAFIDSADLVVAIQGTMGLEAALLGKPVIMLGESPVLHFPSASPVGAIANLPELIRKKLEVTRPSRPDIVDAYAAYLQPFVRAGYNDWTTRTTSEEIVGYVKLLSVLAQYVATHLQAKQL